MGRAPCIATCNKPHLGRPPIGTKVFTTGNEIVAASLFLSVNRYFCRFRLFRHCNPNHVWAHSLSAGKIPLISHAVEMLFDGIVRPGLASDDRSYRGCGQSWFGSMVIVQ